jgi:hypothetical protein
MHRQGSPTRQGLSCLRHRNGLEPGNRVESSHANSDSGLFVVSNLPVGNYTPSAASAGFKRFVVSDIRVNLNDRLDIRVKMEIGGTTEPVTVSETGVLLKTESAEQSTLIGAQQTQALPLNGRLFSQLVELVSGVVSANGTIGNDVGIASDTTVSRNGSRSNSNLWLLSGQNNVQAGGNGQNVVTPPLDSLQEFKVLQSNYSG